MQAACGVADDDVAAARSCRCDGVKNDGGGVRALVLADDVAVRTLRPDLKLIGCRGAERVARAQQDLLALIVQLVGKLADGGRLADAVDADDENDRRLCIQLQGRIADVQHIGKNAAQGKLGLVDGLDALLLRGLAQTIHNGLRRVHTEVRDNEAFLKIVIELVVQLTGGKDAADGTGRLAQSLLEFFKKSHVFDILSG